MDHNQRIALTPAYEPDGKLVTLAEELEREGFPVVIVNDGSGADSAGVFRETAHDAILAINGDYYGAREQGYIIRNGAVYRDTADSADVLCVCVDGTMEIVDPAAAAARELVKRDVWQAFSFGPAPVEDGALPRPK